MTGRGALLVLVVGCGAVAEASDSLRVDGRVVRVDALVAAGGVAEAEARAAAAGGEPPRAQLQVALDALATAAVAKWREAEGSFDDISIIIAEVKGVSG